jgi:toxin ParE1/3/4
VIGRKVRLSTEAIQDIAAIGDEISQYSPRRAAKFTDDIGGEFDLLREMPERFAKVRPHENLRRKVFGKYLIFYRVSETAVDIVHIIHGVMDYEAILFPDDGGES